MTPPIPLVALLPEIILLVFGCAALLIGDDARRGRSWTPWIALSGIILALLAGKLFPPILPDGVALAGCGLLYGNLAIFVRVVTLVVGVLIVAAASSQAHLAERGEFFANLMFALCGLLLVGAADDLAVLFLAIELVSIPTYIMVALSRQNPRALEAGTKYFYLGAVSAALTAYGFSFLYGVNGTLSLADGAGLVKALHQPATSVYFVLASAGVVLSISGLLFKVSAVPLHFYVADVYQGASGPVAGVLGFVPKLAGFVAILKIVALTGQWTTFSPSLFWMLWIVAALSMTIGNALALMQTNIKRLLAYSGVAHAGYMMLGVMAGPGFSNGLFADGAAAVLFYAVAYGLANLAAFTTLGLLRVRGEPCETVADIAGLVRRHPGLALLMGLALFTLMGIPPTPGFWGKLNLFGSAFGLAQGVPPAEQWWVFALIVIGLLNAAVGAAYYLRVIAAMLLYENDRPAEAMRREGQQMGAILAILLIVIFSIFPTILYTGGRRASTELAARSTPDADVVAQNTADARP